MTTRSSESQLQEQGEETGGAVCEQCRLAESCQGQHPCIFEQAVQRIYAERDACLVFVRANAGSLIGTGFEPEDVFQAVAVDVLRSQLRNPSLDKVNSKYLIKSLQNRITSLCRPNYRNYFLYGTEIDFSGEGGRLVEMLPSGEKDAASVFEELEEFDRKSRAIAQLPKESRVAVELYLEGGSSQEEIAESLGIPLGQFRVRLSKGQRELRKILLEL